MRVLVLYAHPLETSFNSALHAQVVASLRARGHEVDDCDLYREAFDPRLSAEDRLAYNDAPANRRRVASYAERLKAANALVLVYPIWNEGFPAILKGFLDRVFLPGVAFVKSPEGGVKPALDHIGRLAAVCTYGATRFTTILMGDPTRRVVKRLVRSMTGPRAGCEYLALYDMDRTTPKRRAAFLDRVARAFASW